MAGIPSVDLGNCYDAIAHLIASIALQAFQVPLATVVLSLSVLQTMTFYLRTGYVVSKTGYGGSELDPTFGLGQGNGMAPSGFSAVSSLMVRAFEQLGHASSFSGAWTGILFALAAIIYVDDTDLLLRARCRDMTMDEFHSDCQEAVTNWGKIVLATGGYFKAAKCFWYMGAGSMEFHTFALSASFRTISCIFLRRLVPLRLFPYAVSPMLRRHLVFGPALLATLVFTLVKRWRRAICG